MLGWLFSLKFWLCAFVLYFLYTRPGSAAALVHRGLHLATSAGDSLSTFVSHI